MFAAVNVGLTMGIGTLLALLLVRVSTWVRIPLTAALVLVWSMPVVVAIQVWYWMTNFENGVAEHDPRPGAARLVRLDALPARIVTALIVWGAMPFVVDHALRRPGAGPARAGRGRRDRRRPALARLQGRHLPDPEADLPRPDEPFDHLGLRRLHAAVPADRQGAPDASNYLMAVYVYMRATPRTTTARAPRSRS